ncbi:MAG TPA: flagellar assembly protein FliW [Longimicrobiaceae bacterium]
MTATVVALPTDRRPMIVASDLLGELTVQQDELITFPTGILGFPACRDFVLIPSEREGLYWLQSAEHSSFAFLLVDPFLAVEGFTVELSPNDRAELEIESESDVIILAIVTLATPERGGCTANLQGPLAFNLRTRRAKQIAVPNSEYGVRWPVDLARM